MYCRAAKTLNCKVWELTEAPLYWLEVGLLIVNAEVWAENRRNEPR